MTATQAPAPNPAAQWLLAEYDATDNIFENFEDDVSGLYWQGLYVQPLFRLKSDMEPGAEMRVTANDYRDPGRWWL